MDSREFLETVDWETNIYDVVLVSEETEETPAQWRVTVKPKDQNDIGSDIPIEIDFYLIDNMGNQFRVIDKEYESVAGNVLVSDDFRCGWCPQPDLTGLIVKTVGNGAAPHVSSAKLDRLDSIAKQNIANREKDILWKYPKDINEKWHPEGLLFTADPTNNKIINWVAGKIFITLWPDNLISDYLVDNVISKNGYHPERQYTVVAGTYTCVDDAQYYIYVKLPLLASETTATIVISKTYIFERYYEGFILVLMGTYTIPDEDGKRSFLMQWNNTYKLPEAVQNVSNTLTGWNPSAFYNEVTPSFNESNRTLSLTPLSPATTFEYFVQGVKYTKTGIQSLQITDITGMHFVVYNGATLEETDTAGWISALKGKTKCLVSAIYWNATHQVAILKAAECHTWTITGQDHYWKHHTIGTRYGGGLVLSIASNNWQLDVTEGEIFDEDIDILIKDSTTAIFGQNLTVLESKKLYREGLAEWHQDIAIPANIVYLSPANQVYHNINTAGTWIHEKLILKLAHWLDTDFELWCDEKISELLRDGSTSLSNLTPAEALLKSVQQMVDHERQIKQLQNGYREIHAEVLEISAQLTTRPDYYTIVGYASKKKVRVGNDLAKPLGKKAAKICLDNGIPVDRVNDTKWGTVGSYPSFILEELFVQEGLMKKTA